MPGLCQKEPISGKGLAGIFTIVQDALLQAAGWSHWRRQWQQWRRRDEHQDASNVRAWRTRSGELPHQSSYRISSKFDLDIWKYWLVYTCHGTELLKKSKKLQDYPILATVPRTSFTCVGKAEGGYYADVETGCQVKKLSTGSHNFKITCSMLNPYSPNLTHGLPLINGIIKCYPTLVYLWSTFYMFHWWRWCTHAGEARRWWTSTASSSTAPSAPTAPSTARK